MPIVLEPDAGGGSDLTAQSLLADVSRLLNDPYRIRWPRDVLLYHLNNGIRQLYQQRPDLFLVTGGSMKALRPITVAGLEDGYTVPVGLESRQALVAYCAGWCWAENDDDPQSIEKSKAQLELFQALVRQ